MLKNHQLQEKKSKIDYRYWGWMLFEKCETGLTLLKRTKLSKQAQEKHDLVLKKLNESNRWWNDWKFQLYWNMLEWVDPKSTPNSCQERKNKKLITAIGGGWYLKDVKRD